ncbi:LytR/AlgR family response regulator transcription factor [Ruminococcus intestinalis]|uniref:LytR/AlgR family response regulator transcription factor n=1 Tax=Ruminococcus intestinalis TaxID=2763066 RepID=UPI003F7E4298
MKIAVIDDEQRYMDILARVCNGYFTIRSEQGSVDCFLNGQDFLNKCSENLYDAAFIDIYMSPINGIELAEELRKINKDILIVFVTTSSDFMMQAFSVHAFHYIIKPYMPEQIYKVLDEAAFYIKDKAKFIRIVCDRKSVMISVKEIMSIESDAHYLNISVVSGMTYRTRMTMNEFLKLTNNDERFIPVNRGVVLNADYIERIDGALCIMGNGTRFSIKVREKSIIEKRVRDHMFKKLRENQRI